MHEASTRSPFGQSADAGADRHDRPDGLVSEDPSRADRRHVAAENVQVRTANGDRVDADDRVSRILDDRVRHLGPRALAGSAVHKGFHHASYRFDSAPDSPAAAEDRPGPKVPCRGGTGPPALSGGTCSAKP